MPEETQIRPQDPATRVPSEIHTMPSKFLSGQSSPKGNRKIFFILIVVLGLVVVVGSAALFFRSTNDNSSNVNNTNTTTNITTNVNENVNVNVAVAPTVVSGSLLDAAKKPLATATLTIPDGALDDASTVAISAFAPNAGAYASDEAYRPIAAVYLIAPQSVRLNEAATLSLSYTDADLSGLSFAARESSLTIAVWESDHWTKKTSVVDQTKNTVSMELSELPDDAVAIVVPVPEGSSNTNVNANGNTNQTVTSALDSDRDGLTNQEETLYGTDAGEEDTDHDTYLDGAEVISLYDPNSTKRLADTALVRTYSNTAFRYTILHPTGWAVGPLDGGAIVTFTTITGEFVQVSVVENTKHESARSWYRALNPGVNPSGLRDIAVGSVTGVAGPDGLNVYLADAQYIYQISYNIGIKDEANYLTTFAMMYNSFRTNSASTNSNTATNGNTNVNANTNTNNNTNANTNANGNANAN